MTVRQQARQGRFRGVRTPVIRKRVSQAREGKPARETGAKSICPNCRKRFKQNPNQARHEFCSPNCRKRAWEKKRIIGLLISTLKEVMERLGEA